MVIILYTTFSLQLPKANEPAFCSKIHGRIILILLIFSKILKINGKWRAYPLPHIYCVLFALASFILLGIAILDFYVLRGLHSR